MSFYTYSQNNSGGSDGCGDAQTTIQAARYIEKFVARKEKTS